MKAEFICHEDFENVTPVELKCRGDEFLERNYRECDERFLFRHILYRRRAVLHPEGRAVLSITADDHYKLYINGKFVTEGPAPSYPERYYYNEIEVSEYLCDGENVIAVHTFYQGLINRVWTSGDRRSMLWLALDIDGERSLVSDESFLVCEHSGYSRLHEVGYSTAFMERYDSSAKEVEFYKPNFDDSYWKNAKIYKNANYNLQKQPTEQLVYENIYPVKTVKAENKIKVDFGREAVGYLSAAAKGMRGDKILMHFSEELIGADDISEGEIRYDLRANCLYEEEWLLSGGEDRLVQYDYKAFRYAELIVPEGVSIEDIHLVARYYPYSQRAVYKTENEDLKRVLKLCLETVKYTTQEQFVDCPTREKGQYLGDVTIAARAHAVATGNTVMMKKALRDFFLTSSVCEGLLAVSTSSYMQEIADYSLQIAASVLWVYERDGDMEFLAEARPFIEGVYRYFRKFENERGLLSCVNEKWNLVDWPANLRDGYSFPLPNTVGPGAHNVLNAFYVGFLSDMNRMYEALGVSEGVDVDRVKRAFVEAFYSSEIGLFADDEGHTHAALHSNVLPLLFGIVDDADLTARIIDMIEKKGLTACGVYIAYFVLAALVKVGRRDLAERLASAEGAWLLMISEGATTTFEAWGKEQKWNTSLCHPWAVAPVIIFAEDTRPY